MFMKNPKALPLRTLHPVRYVKSLRARRLADKADRLLCIIEQNGLTSGRMWNNQAQRYVDGPVCLLGGIQIVNGRGKLAADMIGAQKSALGRALRQHIGQKVWEFNDTAIRSARFTGNRDLVTNTVRDFAAKMHNQVEMFR